jgi:uncharacterized membrane protein
MWQKISKIYPLYLELLPLFLMLAMLSMAVINFAGLPEQIPTHFNLQGIPDNLSSKNELFVYLGSAVFVYILMSGMSVVVATNKDPSKLINLPEKIKDAMTPVLAEHLRLLLVRNLFALKVMLIGMSAYLLYSNIELALNRITGLGYWPLILLGVILLAVVGMLLRIFRLV